MDSNISSIISALIQNGLISQNHVVIFIIVAVLYIFRKSILPFPQNSQNNPSSHDCIMIKEHEVKLNTIIDKINDVTLGLQSMKSSIDELNKKIDADVYDIKVKLTENNHEIQNMENIKELLTTFISRNG